MPDSSMYQEFNLHTAMQIPQVRDRFERGVKLHELKQLKTFFHSCSEKEYLRKTYGPMIQDLAFLENSGAMKLPCAAPGSHISSRRHWIALNGYYKVDQTTLLDEGIELRRIINTLSIHTPVLILDNEAWSVYKAILRYSRLNTMSVFKYLTYVVSVLSQTEMPYGSFVDDRFVKWLLWAKDPRDVEDEVEKVLEKVTFDDHAGLVPLILNGSYCFPIQNWISCEGYYYLMSVPSWTLSSKGPADYTDNQLREWDFFTC